MEKGVCSHGWWVVESWKRTVKYNRWDSVRWTTSTFCISSQKGKFWTWSLTTRTTECRGAYGQAYAGLYHPSKVLSTIPSALFFLNLELIDYLILCTVIRYKVLLGDNFIFLKHSKKWKNIVNVFTLDNSLQFNCYGYNHPLLWFQVPVLPLSGTKSTPTVAPSSWFLQSCAKEVTWKIARRRTQG